MKALRLSVVLATAGMLMVAVQANGDDETAGEIIESKGIKIKAASTIDFGQALELPFDSLSTLGVRIQQARKAADPVGLATAATELGVFEAVSKKQAEITAAELTDEAVQLAKARRNSSELMAVAKLVKGHPVAKELEARADAAAEREAEEAAAAKKGAKPKAIQGTLHMENYSGHFIDIYVNGRQVGWVVPYGQGPIYVNQPSWETTVLFGRSRYGNNTWGPVNVSGTRPSYLWKLGAVQ